jgi:hypothetical protein
MSVAVEAEPDVPSPAAEHAASDAASAAEVTAAAPVVAAIAAAPIRSLVYTTVAAGVVPARMDSHVVNAAALTLAGNTLLAVGHFADQGGAQRLSDQLFGRLVAGDCQVSQGMPLAAGQGTSWLWGAVGSTPTDPDEWLWSPADPDADWRTEGAPQWGGAAIDLSGSDSGDGE